MSIRDSSRILVIDDNKAIHDDFNKVLVSADPNAASLASLEAELFDQTPAATSTSARRNFQIDSAFQGREGLAKVVAALDEGRPYSLAFIDVRMPPGWDGVETVGHLWKCDPQLQVVLCTAYSDYDWNGIMEKVESADRLLILRKPFDNIEVVQLAHALTRKWEMHGELHERLADLEARVLERTKDLAETNAELRREAERRAGVEQQLRVLQRLEAVGQLAQGLAHEINTPLAVVCANLSFLRESFAEVAGLVPANPTDSPARRAAESPVNLPFLLEEAFRAFAEAEACAKRVKGIIKSSREFASPQVSAMMAVDLNQAITNTLAIATNDYASVAQLDTDLGALPPVVCHIGSVNQVVLGLVANAARALMGRPNGQIRVRSHVDVDGVVITVSDNGCGIPDGLRDQLFASSGTGELARAHAIVVTQHGGAIAFDSEVGKGTTFSVTLPLQQRGLLAA